jgi:hypothetical protein
MRPEARIDGVLIGCFKHRVVLLGQRPAAGFHSAIGAVAHRLEFPDGADAIEVAHMGAPARVHAPDMGIHREQRQALGHVGRALETIKPPGRCGPRRLNREVNLQNL